MEQIFIEINNSKAYNLLESFEELGLIKILKRDNSTHGTKLSDKYRGIISKAEGQDLNEHIKEMR